MTASERLKEIELSFDDDRYEASYGISKQDVTWLIERVKHLEKRNERLREALKQADKLFADDRARTEVINNALEDEGVEG